MSDYINDLTDYLLMAATGSGYLKGDLLSSPDIDDAWLNYAASIYADAVHNFNEYPEFCLACAGYLGMAVAHLWDKNWEQYKDTPYSFFQGPGGFDDMDDHITGNILRESVMWTKSRMDLPFIFTNGQIVGWQGQQPGARRAFPQSSPQLPVCSSRRSYIPAAVPS